MCEQEEGSNRKKRLSFGGMYFDRLDLFINLLYNMHVTSIIKTLKIGPFFLHVYVLPSASINEKSQ